MTYDRRDSVVTDDDADSIVIEEDRAGSNTGAILGIIAIVVLLLAVWYMALGPGATSTGTTNNTIDNGGAPAASQEAPAAS